MTIAILDYGAGNLRSVELAFARLGVPTVVTNDAAVAMQADGLILMMSGRKDWDYEGFTGHEYCVGLPWCEPGVYGGCRESFLTWRQNGKTSNWYLLLQLQIFCMCCAERSKTESL